MLYWYIRISALSLLSFIISLLCIYDRLKKEHPEYKSTSTILETIKGYFAVFIFCCVPILHLFSFVLLLSGTIYERIYKAVVADMIKDCDENTVDI